MLQSLLNSRIAPHWRTALFVLAAVAGTGEAVGQPAATANATSPADAGVEPTEETISNLVRQLGAPQFRRREQAMLELAEIGAPALKHLQREIDSDDPEIAIRAQFLYRQLIENDLDYRLSQFTAGKTDGSELSGWSFFQRYYNDSPLLRQLFADAYERFPDLIAALSDAGSVENNDDLQQFLITAVERLQYKLSVELEHASEAELFAVMAPFLEGDPHLTTNASNTLRTFIGTVPFTTALNEEGKREIFEKLGSAWVRHAPLATWDGALAFSMQYGLEGGYDLSKEIAATPEVDEEILSFAILAIGRFGTRGDIPMLRRFFDDKRKLGPDRVFEAPHPDDDATGQGRIHTQVRDFAIAVAVRLAGGDARAAGFPKADTHPRSFFDYESIGFYSADDEPRRAAIEYLDSLLAQESGS